MNTNTTTKKQVTIVTGASSGMGLGITQALLQHGYRVVANSRNISRSKDLKPSSDLILVDGDISKMDSAIKVADAAIKHFDRIDLLVNSAGINIAKPFTDYTPADFELMIGTNVAGYFFITQRVVTQMRKQKSGHIVGISTVSVDQPLAVETITLQVVTSPQCQRFTGHWRWNYWLMVSGRTQSRLVLLTLQCTPTTTTKFSKNSCPFRGWLKSRKLWMHCFIWNLHPW